MQLHRFSWWRLNGTGSSHGNHLHTSILYTAAAENDVTPYFVNSANQHTPVTEVSHEPMDVIWYIDQLHSFWINEDAKGVGTLQHAFDPGGSENLRRCAPTESLSVKHGVKCIINPKTLNLEVHTVTNTDQAQIVFYCHPDRNWSAVRINNK